MLSQRSGKALTGRRVPKGLGLGLAGAGIQPAVKGLVSLLSKFNARARVRPKAGEVLGCGVCNSAAATAAHCCKPQTLGPSSFPLAVQV